MSARNSDDARSLGKITPGTFLSLGHEALANLDAVLAEQLDIAFPAIPELEAELLLHAVRALVALVVSGPNRRKTQLVEPVCHRGARRLRSIAAAP